MTPTPVHSPGFRHLTLGGLVRSAAVRAPERAAIRHGPRSLSYRDLVARMARIAVAGAGSLDLRVGDRVALIAPNCLEYLEIVIGLADLGVTVATLNPRMTRPELAAILDDCAPRVIFVHPDCEAAIDPGWQPDLRIVRLGAQYEALLEGADDRLCLPAIPETTPFALAYTSGTTGRPKGVLLSHRSRALTFLAMAAEYGCFGPDDEFLALAPLCHGAGFVFACAALCFGGTMSLFIGNDPEEILTCLHAGSVTGVFMVPTHLSRMFGLPDAVLARHSGHRLKAIISNAAALPQPLKERAISHFGEGLLHETYGSTEAGIVTNNRPRDQRRKPGSVGLPFAGMDVELRGADGAVVAAGEVGELFCRGPYTFNGYYERPAETAETIVDDWVTVGDMAVRDGDGFITIVDRKKDMVVTGGLNVYPREIENVIAGVPGVREVAVVGLADTEWGERLHAFIVADGEPPSRDAVSAACRAQLAGFKVPRTITFLEELPRNTGGKVLKRALRELAA